MVGSCKEEKVRSNDAPEDCTLPHPHALLHVTSRRKAPPKKKSFPVENNDLAQMQVEYEDLLLNFETQRTMSEIQINYLTRKLAESGLYMASSGDDSMFHGNTDESLNESEAILVIKQLQEKITMLEIEKSLSQQNFDGVVELVTRQQICAKEKFEEEEDFESLTKLSKEVQEIMSEVQNSRNFIENVSSVVDELFQSFSIMLNLFIDLKFQATQNNSLVKAIIDDHMKLHSCMRCKVNELENEKLHLCNQSMDCQNKIEELSLDVQNSAKAFSELSEQQEIEKSELLSEIRTLQKDILCLSSSSLVKEKENMRKDLEKTKTKLREIESKLKNTIQEKTKLEGEKACAEREIKQLHAQKVILERDINKHDSISGRRRDSAVDRSSNVFDAKRSKGLAISFEQTMQEDYKRLEVLAFEMETTIASLEEELATARKEKEQATSTIESLALEMQILLDKLNMSNSEMSTFEETVSSLRSSLYESKLHNEKLESSINMLVEEKEELAMQLTDALLAMEEEKAIWSAIEKTSIQAIEEKSNSYSANISFLSSEMSQVRNELESSRDECKVLMERLLLSEKNAELEKCQSMKKSEENERLRDDLKVAADHSRRSEKILASKLERVTLEHRHACEEAEKLRMELSVLIREREDLSNRIRALDAGSVLLNDFQNLKNQHLNIQSERDRLRTQIEGHQREVEVEYSKENNDDRLLKTKEEVELTKRISFLEAEMHNNEVSNSKEKAKLRMRLRGTQGKLEAFRFRHKEAVDELDFMNRQYEAASVKLKERLASYGIEVLNLKKQLATEKGL